MVESFPTQSTRRCSASVFTGLQGIEGHLHRFRRKPHSPIPPACPALSNLFSACKSACLGFSTSSLALSPSSILSPCGLAHSQHTLHLKSTGPRSPCGHALLPRAYADRWPDSHTRRLPALLVPPRTSAGFKVRQR